MSIERLPNGLTVEQDRALDNLAAAIADLHPTHPTEPTPIGTALDVEYIARRVAASRPFAARVCGRCGATGSQPCVTASGKVMRRFHVARG